MISSPIEKRWNHVLGIACFEVFMTAAAVWRKTQKLFRENVPTENAQHKLPMILLHVVFSGNICQMVASTCLRLSTVSSHAVILKCDCHSFKSERIVSPQQVYGLAERLRVRFIIKRSRVQFPVGMTLCRLWTS